MNIHLQHRFRLFVLGGSPAGERALYNFARLNRKLFGGRAELEVVDIARDPERAATDRVIAVPLLIRLVPQPSFRIIGDLSDTGKLSSLLIPRQE